jgi:hypothetical protein
VVCEGWEGGLRGSVVFCGVAAGLWSSSACGAGRWSAFGQLGLRLIEYPLLGHLLVVLERAIEEWKIVDPLLGHLLVVLERAIEEWKIV